MKFRERWPRLNRYVILLIFGVAGNAVLWWLWSRFSSGPAPLVLRFRIGGGIDVLGERSLLATIPAIGSLILLLNAALTVILSRRDVGLATLIGSVAVFVQVVLAAALLMLLGENVVS